MKRKRTYRIAAAGLLQRIEHQKSAPISSLPELPADGGVLFAESPSPSQTVSNYSLPVRYEGNVVIGETRGYVHQIVILDDSAWDGLEAKQLTIAVCLRPLCPPACSRCRLSAYSRAKEGI